LLLACELALAGITPIVLDSSPGPNIEPRANGIGGPAVVPRPRGLYEQLTGTPDRPHPLGAGDVPGALQIGANESMEDTSGRRSPAASRKHNRPLTVRLWLLCAGLHVPHSIQ
jgi:hypothetical protein